MRQDETIAEAFDVDNVDHIETCEAARLLDCPARAFDNVDGEG